MRWLNREKVGSLGWLSWVIINKHLDSLVSSSADAGWAGISNTGKICDMLESGVVPDFGGGGGSNEKMIRAIEQLTHKDSGYGHLFESLSPMQRLCLFSAVLAEGRPNARGVTPSNAVIVGTLAQYAAELGFEQRHFTMTENRFEKHVLQGKTRLIRAVNAEIEALSIELSV
ncbi:hypothetical protein [Marinomonas transparens]|uniref:Uncharacterized protein n=1 Tax=Marinomonas transparens TaxID=2795388 RepID=A0A934N1V0_9GAMM|nr:hypothetical protein [Marinomonas transparens]MBJ7539875.1 hypothetical protein [Marinomonas transparens]